jgi:hypothetical protein
VPQGRKPWAEISQHLRRSKTVSKPGYGDQGDQPKRSTKRPDAKKDAKKK